MSEAIRYFFNSLTGNEIERLSGGRIKRMDPFAAAGLIGSWMVETGSDDLSNLDVVEVGNNQAGRGLSQYSHSRRGPYDKARQAAINSGVDPNSKEFQFKYFIEEYLGKHDPAPGKSLIGWTRSLENLPKFNSVAEAASHFTSKYFRPSTPHLDRRIQKGQSVYNLRNSFASPNSQAPAAPKGRGLSEIFRNPVLKKLGVKLGNRSFNIDKLERTLGSIAQGASARDVGFGIFASQKGNLNKAKKAWNNLGKSGQRAYTKLGRQVSLASPQVFASAGSQPYRFSKNDLKIGSGAREYKSPTFDINYDTGFRPGGVNSIGGLPGGQDIAQWEVANSSYFKNKGSRFGQKAFQLSHSTINRINNRSYGGSLDLGKTLGISGSAAGRAAAAGGNMYGGKAFSSGFNAGAINAAVWGG